MYERMKDLTTQIKESTESHVDYAVSQDSNDYFALFDYLCEESQKHRQTFQFRIERLHPQTDYAITKMVAKSAQVNEAAFTRQNHLIFNLIPISATKSVHSLPKITRRLPKITRG